MQVSSSIAFASVQTARSDSSKDPTTLIANDLALQIGGARISDTRTGDGDHGHHHGHRHHDRSGEAAEKSQGRLSRLGKALNRLMEDLGGTSVQAAVLVAGEARSQTGVTVSIKTDRVYGLYTDFRGAQGAFGDMSWADSVTILADRVDNVSTAGGGDKLSITARQVQGISTGNDADSLSILADVVRNIQTDDPTGPLTREAADAVAILARLVEGVGTGGGDDAIAIVAGTVVGVDGGAGNDAISVAADVIGAVAGGDGDDAISIATVIGRRDLELAPTLDSLIPALEETALDRMTAAASFGAQIDGGAGNDAISVAAQATIGVSGGTGDDAIALTGGTVGLYYALGDGNDSVALGAGTEAIVQINDDLGLYAVEFGEDSMTLHFNDGSMTFTGLSNSGAIGLRQGGGEVIMLHPGILGTLDLLA